MFGVLQLLDILIFLGGARSLDSFLITYKASETKVYFPYEWSDDPEKLNNTQLYSYETFFTKLGINDPLDNNRWGVTSNEALSKLKMKQLPATGQENY